MKERRGKNTPLRLPTGYELLTGFHSVHEALCAGRRTIRNIYLGKGGSGRRETIAEQARSRGIEVMTRGMPDLLELTGEANHQGVVAVGSPLPLIPEKELGSSGPDADGDPLVLVLESIEDPRNLGALIRTALCAGADQVVISKDRCAGPTPAVSRSSAGAMEHTALCRVTNTRNCLEKLKKKGFWIVGLDAGGDRSLYEVDLSGPIALVVGGEHRGIRPLVQKSCDFLVSLPMAGSVTSLNASVAGGIALYEVMRRRSVKAKKGA